MRTMLQARKIMAVEALKLALAANMTAAYEASGLHGKEERHDRD